MVNLSERHKLDVPTKAICLCGLLGGIDRQYCILVRDFNISHARYCIRQKLFVLELLLSPCSCRLREGLDGASITCMLE